MEDIATGPCPIESPLLQVQLVCREAIPSNVKLLFAIRQDTKIFFSEGDGGGGGRGEIPDRLWCQVMVTMVSYPRVKRSERVVLTTYRHLVPLVVDCSVPAACLHGTGRHLRFLFTNSHLLII
jgi:hypothetical protein